MVNETFINYNETLGIIFKHVTLNVTGSQLGTIIFFLFMFLACALAFKLGMDWVVILIFPVIIAIAAFTSSIVTIAGLIIFYMAVLGARYWLMR